MRFCIIVLVVWMGQLFSELLSSVIWLTSFCYFSVQVQLPVLLDKYLVLTTYVSIIPFYF